MAKPREFSDSERAVWRGRAQVWLRQELLPATSSPREQLLLQSLQDADLANVREESLIAELPASERESWVRLWKEVRQSLQNLSGNDGGD